MLKIIIHYISKLFKQSEEQPDDQIANTKTDKKDKRDLKVQLTETLPSFYVIPNLPPIRSQKSIGSCFIAGTKILMEDYGYKNIEDIYIGEKVITHKGIPKKVTNRFHRLTQANLVSIQPIGVHTPIICTKEHPFLTPDGWIEAKDITRKDYVFMPDNNITKDLTIYSLERDKDFLWILGLYLAEGCIVIKGKNYRICFTLHEKETELIEKIEKFFNKHNLRISKQYKKSSNAVNIRLSSSYFGKLLLELGGKLCHKKELNPRLMFLDPKLQMFIYEGWFAGDGTKRIIRARHTGVTTSLKLAKQLRLILLRNGFFSTVINKWSYPGRKDAFSIDYNENNKDNYRRYKVKDGYFVKVFRKKEFKQSINSRQISAKGVYNLEIEDDNSYLVEGIAVHNCASHAAIGCYEIQLSKRRFLEGSELFHYYNARKFINKTYPKDKGMTIRDACKTLDKHGYGFEVLWPYNTQRFNERPAQIAYVFSKLYQVDRYQRLYDLDSIKVSIHNNIPILCGIHVNSSFHDLNSYDYTYNPQTKSGGGHAVIIVGFDNVKGQFIIRNSWNSFWGNRGYFRMPYEAFKKNSFDWWRIIKK